MAKATSSLIHIYSYDCANLENPLKCRTRAKFLEFVNLA